MRHSAEEMMCEYCNRDDVRPLYAWHADTWCADCIRAYGKGLKMIGTLEDAPTGRPANPRYAQPFIITQGR